MVGRQLDLGQGKFSDVLKVAVLATKEEEAMADRIDAIDGKEEFAGVLALLTGLARDVILAFRLQVGHVVLGRGFALVRSATHGTAGRSIKDSVLRRFYRCRLGWAQLTYNCGGRAFVTGDRVSRTKTAPFRQVGQLAVACAFSLGAHDIGPVSNCE